MQEVGREKGIIYINKIKRIPCMSLHDKIFQVIIDKFNIPSADRVSAILFKLLGIKGQQNIDEILSYINKCVR